MAWYDKQRWTQERTQLEREALADSVEEMTSEVPPIVEPRITEQGQRLAGRTTRVHLQAIRPGHIPEVSAHRIPALDPRDQQGNSVLGAQPRDTGSSPARGVPPGGPASPRPWPRPLGGRGMIKQGQGAVTIPNAAITERSVVTVMLTSNPGPVVVQYISLHPRMGFTVHLSSPATANAFFNYAIWPF
jgi:hypothetical protein